MTYKKYNGEKLNGSIVYNNQIFQIYIYQNQNDELVFWFSMNSRLNYIHMATSENLDSEGERHSVYLCKFPHRDALFIYDVSTFMNNLETYNIFHAYSSIMSNKTTIYSRPKYYSMQKENYPIEEVMTDYDIGLEILVKGEEMLKKIIPEVREKGLYEFVLEQTNQNPENIIYNLLPILEQYKKSKKEKIGELLFQLNNIIDSKNPGEVYKKELSRT